MLGLLASSTPTWPIFERFTEIPYLGIPVPIGLGDIFALISLLVSLLWSPRFIYWSIANLEYAMDPLSGLGTFSFWLILGSLIAWFVHGSLGILGLVSLPLGLMLLVYCLTFFVVSYRKAREYCKKRGWEFYYKDTDAGIFWAYPPGAVIPTLVPIFKSQRSLPYAEEPVDNN